MIFRSVKFSILLFLFFAFSTSAYYNPGNPIGFVNDYTGTLTSEQRKSLESKLSQFEKDSSNEISIVIIPSLQNDTIENFSSELFKEWGIGKKGKDNGILVLVALENRKMRIEVGYGLEGTITDAQAGWIINNVLKSEFKNSNYYYGISKAINNIISSINGENIIVQDAKQRIKYQEAQNKLNESQEELNDSSLSSKILNGLNFIAEVFLTSFGLIASIALFIVYILIRIIFGLLGRTKSWIAGGILGGIIGILFGSLWESFHAILVFSSIFIPLGLLIDFYLSRHNTFWKRDFKKVLNGKSGKGGGFWGGGSSGGGFGGFGGGSSGGGGASGDW